MSKPLQIEPAEGIHFLLRNIGEVTLHDVTIEKPSKGIPRKMPNNETLAPGQSVEFTLIRAHQSGWPGELMVSWHTQPTPVAIPMPSS